MKGPLELAQSHIPVTLCAPLCLSPFLQWGMEEGGMSPQYLLLVVLTVHVQHKQVVAQAADGDAWGRDGSVSGTAGTWGVLHSLSQECSNCSHTAQLRGCRGAEGRGFSQRLQ